MFGIHQTIYAALASQIAEQICNRKSENFETIKLLPFYQKYTTV